MLLEGPTAIAFVETDGDPVAVAKALADTAKDTKVLELRGGLLSGRTITGADVEELAKLPAPEIVKSQLVGAIVAPLSQLAAILAAPLHDLVALIDARITQLEEGGDTSAAASVAEEAPADDAPAEAAAAPEAEATETTEAPEAEAPADEVVAEAPVDEVVAEAPDETPEAPETSDAGEAPADAENADTGTEEE